MTPTSLPAVVTEYLGLAGSPRSADADAVLACFTDDAEVDDFEDVRIGAEAIRRWWQGPATAYDYTVEVLGGHALGADRFVAFPRLFGDFPGGTAELADRFTLRDGLIAQLEITATDPIGDR
ncbi:MAG TPA: nuclear transport factor 2 family protein [Acidimicrobiales bacterium]